MNHEISHISPLQLLAVALSETLFRVILPSALRQ